MDHLTLHAVRQVGDDLGLRRLGRLWERRVSGKANLGQPQNQRLNLLFVTICGGKAGSSVKV